MLGADSLATKQERSLNVYRNPADKESKNWIREVLPMWYVFFLLTNTAKTIIVGMGIYSFSHSLLWAVIGSMLITGSMSASMAFAFLAYPVIEYYFNGSLTIYSALTVGIVVTQIIATIFIVVRPDIYEKDPTLPRRSNFF